MALTRAWPSDAMKIVGGLAHLVGIDIDYFCQVRAIKDHPWIGKKVRLPNGEGTIINCLTHPRGELMFDVVYPEPVPPVLNGKVILAHLPSYHQDQHRFFASELTNGVKRTCRKPSKSLD